MVLRSLIFVVATVIPVITDQFVVDAFRAISKAIKGVVGTGRGNSCSQVKDDADSPVIPQLAFFMNYCLSDTMSTACA